MYILKLIINVCQKLSTNILRNRDGSILIAVPMKFRDYTQYKFMKNSSKCSSILTYVCKWSSNILFSEISTFNIIVVTVKYHSSSDLLNTFIKLFYVS